MWIRKTIGVLGAASGVAYFQYEHRVVHADASQTHAPATEVAEAGKHPIVHQRTHNPIPAFDINASPIGDADGQTGPPDLKELQLRNAQVFFRHGARSPLRILSFLEQPEWPKDTILADPALTTVKHSVIDLQGMEVDSGLFDSIYLKTVFKGGTPAGQLTKEGKLQAYDLGRRLRQDYIEKHGLINTFYHPSQVYVRSTNMMRTIESAKWLLTGLFGANKKGEDVTIYVEPAEREILYPNHIFCLNLKLANKRLFRSVEEIPGLKEHRQELQKLLDYNEDSHNKRKLNYVDLRDEVAARQAHGLPVPKVVLDAMEKIEHYAVSMLTFMVAGSTSYKSNLRKEMMRLACGPVLHLIRDNADSALMDDGFFKLQLYSCHDSMLMALLVALGIFDGKWPPFAADLTFETFEDAMGNAWIRVMYCGKPQRLPGTTSEIVSVDAFKTLIAPFVVSVDNYREECQGVSDDVPVHGALDEKEE